MTREEAIKIFNTVLFFGKCDCPKEEIEECLKMAIKALKQEPRKGHWLHDGSHWKNRFICSECGYKLFDEPTNFCPNCGAKMNEGVEE